MAPRCLACLDSERRRRWFVVDEGAAAGYRDAWTRRALFLGWDGAAFCSPPHSRLVEAMYLFFLDVGYDHPGGGNA